MLVLAAIAATLAFGTPSGDARVDHVRHQRTSDRSEAEAWTFDVRARGDVTTSVTIPVTLAPEARIVGLTIGGSGRAATHDPDVARDWFDTLVARGRQAAIVEARGDDLALRVTTVRPDEPVRITIFVERGRARSWIDEDPTQRLVDDEHAIVALAPDARGPAPTVTIGAPSCACDEGPPPLKRYIKRWIPRVRACYVRAAQVDPGLAGTANLAFSVAPTGGVTDIMVGGSLDSRSVQECLVAEISTWQFPARPGVVARVHYPLQFRLAR
jgi:hypothetical protein